MCVILYREIYVYSLYGLPFQNEQRKKNVYNIINGHKGEIVKEKRKRKDTGNIYLYRKYFSYVYDHNAFI